MLFKIIYLAQDLLETFPDSLNTSKEEIIKLACQVNANSFVLFAC
jgi:hypothetical protein